MRTETIDIYGEITKQIIEAMEAGLPVNWTVAPVMGPEMGQGRLGDTEAVASVVGMILTLVADHVFPGKVEWLRDLHERRIQAASFDANFRHAPVISRHAATHVVLGDDADQHEGIRARIVQ